MNDKGRNIILQTHKKKINQIGHKYYTDRKTEGQKREIQQYRLVESRSNKLDKKTHRQISRKRSNTKIQTNRKKIKHKRQKNESIGTDR